MDLARSPQLGVSAKRLPAGLRVDELPGDNCRGPLVEPALRVDPCGRRSGVLAALMRTRVLEQAAEAYSSLSRAREASSFGRQLLDDLQSCAELV
jgi:hypothetical protein